MGIESFYVSLIDEKSVYTKQSDEYRFLGATDKLVNDFIDFIKKNTIMIRKVRNQKNKFIVNKIIYLTILEYNGFFQGINLEGCFSCYEKALKEFEKISNLLMNHFCSIKVFINGKYYNQKDIYEILKRENRTREIYFNEKYNMYLNTLPGAHFYNRYRFISKFKKIKHSFLIK